MKELFPIPIAEVRPAEDLDALAERVRTREKRSRGSQLDYALKQAADVSAARLQCKRGQWKPWIEKAGLNYTQAWCYDEFGKLSVTESFQALTEEEQWTEWQRIQGNTPPKEEDDALPPVERKLTGYVTLDDWKKMGKDARKKVLATRGDARFLDQGNNTSIRWALWSWNPVTGCLHDCPYCYARDIAERFYEQKFEPALWPDRLKAPHNTPFPEAKAATWMGHKNVFVCSMADLFGRWVPSEWIEAVLAEVRNAPQWNFLFLTKFPIRMAEFDFPENAWVGTTVDCQARVANAERAFRKVKAGVKWLSCEPLIEPLKFDDLGAFNWVVIGGATSSAKTPEWFPPVPWVEKLKAACIDAGVPFFLKTNLSRTVERYPGDEPFREPKKAPEALCYLPTPE